jgi:hypothetical protein
VCVTNQALHLACNLKTKNICQLRLNLTDLVYVLPPYQWGSGLSIGFGWVEGFKKKKKHFVKYLRDCQTVSFLMCLLVLLDCGFVNFILDILVVYSGTRRKDK